VDNISRLSSNILKCETVPLDPCLFLHFNKSHEETLDGIIGTLVDETLGAESPQFLEFEEINSKVFECKSRSQNSFDFAGCFFHQENDQI
jgi:hypothetical protein